MHTHLNKGFEVIHAHAYDREVLDLPIKVTMALYSRWGRDGSFEYQSKRFLSLNLITAGTAHYIQDGRKGIVNKGELFIAHKGSNQQFKTGVQGYLHKRTVILDGWLTDLLIDRLGLKRTDLIKSGNAPLMIGYFRKIYALFRDKPPGYVQEASSCAYTLIMLLATDNAPGQPAALRKAIDFIGRSPARLIELADIAAAADTSLRQCNRLFLSEMGCSPVQYVISHRLNIAAGMLGDANISIKAVAALVGYQDPLYFSHQFKKRYGVSPRAFRSKRDVDS